MMKAFSLSTRKKAIVPRGTASRLPSLMLSGLDWQVSLTEVCYDDGGMMSVVPGQFVVVRDDNGDPLSIVGSRYQPIQNEVLFDIADAVVNNSDAMYHAAASLRQGCSSYVLLKRSEQLVPLGEESEVIDQFLLVSTSHDATQALTAGLTNVRVVCQNTLNLAMNGMQQKVAVRHTMSSESRVEELKKLISLSEAYGKGLKTFAENTMMHNIDRQWMRRFLNTLLPIKETDSDASKTRTKNKRNEIFAHWLMADNIENVRYTEWGALQAVSEWDQHVRNYRGKDDVTRQENRFLASIGNATLLRRAEDVLLSGPVS